LGFKVGNKLLILVEAQSTWTENILIRGLMYLVQTYQEYIDNTNQNVYSSRKIRLPKPELYVIYTGDRNISSEYISMKDLFWDGDETSALDVKVKIITDSKQGDILNQYITFARICDEQRKLYGRTKKTVNEIIRICMDKNVLKNYLASREKEVKDIMIALFDDEEIMKSFLKSEGNIKKEEGRKEGIAEGRKAGIAEGKKAGIAEGKKAGIAEGILSALKNLIANANKTASEAMSLLGIPEDDRAMYTELLNSSNQT
jgi:hypothetical protein